MKALFVIARGRLLHGRGLVAVVRLLVQEGGRDDLEGKLDR
jgi:hypothetical protein